MEKSHKTCMEQAEIIDTFGTYHTAMSKDQAGGGIHLSCRSDTIPARAPMGHPTPYLHER